MTAPALTLRLPDGSVARLTPVLEADGRPISMLRPVAVTADANGMSIELRRGLTVRLDIEQRGTATTVRTSVRARRAVNVDRLGVRVERGGAEKILVDGYQSWDVTGTHDATQPGSGWWGCAWGAAGQAMTLALDEPPAVGALAIRWGGGWLEAWCTGPPNHLAKRTGDATALGVRLEQGEELHADPLRLSSIDTASRAGIGLPDSPRTAARRQAGWASWNCFGAAIDRQRILEGARLAPRGGEVLIDDGWADRWGDWYARPAMGSLEMLAATLGQQRKQMVLWLAPFLVDKESTVARLHPEWLLRDGSGNPVVDPRAAIHPYVLDASLPEVREHLRRIGERLGRAGVSGLKLDFLYAGAAPGRRHGMSSIRAGRAGFAAIAEGFRSTAGEHARIDACGAPGPMVAGIADSCRSYDDAVIAIPTRHTFPVGAFIHNDTIRATQAGNLAARAWLWGATLPPDPDAITLARVGISCPVSDATAQKWIAMAVAGGGPLLLSDHPDRISARRLLQFHAAARRVLGADPMPQRSRDPLAPGALGGPPPRILAA